MKSDKINVICPLYNEGDLPFYFYETIHPILDSIDSLSWEITFINDGSTDNTLSSITKISEKDKRVKVIDFSRNFGKEAAMTAGIHETHNSAVIIIDVDLQDPPLIIPQMIEKWRSGAEVVIGERSARRHDSLIKKLTATWFYKIHNNLSKVKIPQNVGDFRLMAPCVVEAMKNLPEQQRFMKGLFAWAGFKTATIQYERASRADGTTKFSIIALWNFALEGITSFSTIPLRIWTYLGSAGVLLSLIYGLFVFFEKLFSRNFSIDSSLILFFIMFIGNINIIIMGIMGEYIGRIYMESKRRPVYIIRKKVNF